jgi:hypothetical protein
MGRTRNSGLESPRSRSGLKKRTPAYWTRLGKGQHLGYRKGATGGFWLARFYDPRTHKRLQASLGFADDEDQPNGTDVLSFDQASAMARAWFKQVADDVKRSSTPAPAPSPNKMTVIQAVESYLEYLIAEKKGGKQAETAARHYILSKPIGNRLVVQLTMEEIDAWRKEIAETPRGPGSPRRATAPFRSPGGRGNWNWRLKASRRPSSKQIRNSAGKAPPTGC